MPREHGEKGEFVETITLEDVLRVFDAVEGPVILSADVADELDCTRETARRKLEQLHNRDDLERRKVSRRVIYWKPREDESFLLDADEDADTLDVALGQWDPDTQANMESARAQTRRATEYLREHAPERFKAGELKDALAGESSFSPRHWWERAVQPGLRHLTDCGLVEYRAGYHDYQYIGED